MMLFFASALFRIIVFPLASIALGVGIKWVSQNDRYESFKKEDLAVGLELTMTALLMYIVLTTDRAINQIQMHEAVAELLRNPADDMAEVTRLQNEIARLAEITAISGWVIASMMFGMWSISTVVRKWGWKGPNDMHSWIGIAMPLAFGFLSLVLVMLEASR